MLAKENDRNMWSCLIKNLDEIINSYDYGDSDPVEEEEKEEFYTTQNSNEIVTKHTQKFYISQGFRF